LEASKLNNTLTGEIGQQAAPAQSFLVHWWGDQFTGYF